MKRIFATRIPVKLEHSKSVGAKFSVPPLSPDENDLLHARRFQKRASGRLAAIHEKQQQEIQRLTRWIGSTGQNPANLILHGRTASLDEEVPTSIRTFVSLLDSHEETGTEVRAHKDRRNKQAKNNH